MTRARQTPLDTHSASRYMRAVEGVKRKLSILADAAKYDASCASSGSKDRPESGLGSTQGMGICHSYTPDGRCVSLLKILLTNYCIYDCAYCVNRRSSGVPRASFEPDELVQLTMDFYRRNYIEGLFLSSGVLRSADDTMERMIEVAKRLRLRERFAGYIHLKGVAGASDALVRAAGVYADRVSVNIELPTDRDLSTLAPEKRPAQIRGAMASLKDGIDEAKEVKKTARTRAAKRAALFAPAGQSTQMVIGATTTEDQAVLTTADALYNDYRLRRVYYSGYSPTPAADPSLPSKPVPLVREHRLYQADWLLRFYGFSVQEITPATAPNLDLEVDPKLAWALRNRTQFPVDVNRAPREQLLRVPGLGVRNVDRILRTRRHSAITLASLKQMRVALKKVKPFIITADGHQNASWLLDRMDLRAHLTQPQQLGLFGP